VIGGVFDVDYPRTVLELRDWFHSEQNCRDYQVRLRQRRDLDHDLPVLSLRSMRLRIHVSVQSPDIPIAGPAVLAACAASGRAETNQG
jgi:hypothetical protein